MTSTLDSAIPPIQPFVTPDAGAFGHKLAPEGDPLEGAAFDAIYEAKIKPELIKCEAARKQAIKLFFMAMAGGALVLFLEFALTPFLVPGALMPPIWLLIITAIVAFIIGWIPVGAVERTAKQGVISSLCEPLGITYSISGKEAPAWATFLQLKLLPPPSDKSFQDFFTGRRGEIDFALCEATLAQGSGKNRRVVFQGQIFKLTTPKHRLSTTVVARNTGWMSRFECPNGLRTVGLEDPRFNKDFAVFGSDQVEAREILTPTFMEQLVDLQTAYSAAHLRCAFCGPDLLIAMESPSRFEIGNMFTNLVEQSRVQGIAHDIEQVFKMIDAFAAA